MVAALVLVIGLLGTFSMVDTAQRSTQANATRTAAVTLIREVLEHARSLDYEKVTPADLVTQLRTKPNLTGRMDGPSWIIRRRGVDMTVGVTTCTFDDPLDGLSATPPQNACPAASPIPNPPAETNPDDFRRIALTVSWREKSKILKATQSGLIANPGGGLGPRITSFPDPFASQVTNATSVTFAVTTTTAATVRWSMDDGISGADATGGPTSWSFSWNIGTVGVGNWTLDGTYTANAQPFDGRGVPGERRAATVLLNRRIPLAPTGFVGGRSDVGGGSVELEWAKSPERDVIGYRVYRTESNSTNKRVCPLSTAAADAVIKTTSCTDPAPLSVPLYRVVAVDRATLGNPASSTREGDAATLDVPALGPRPDPPTGLTGALVDDRVQLTWTAPSGATPLYYRIYRDGTRIDRTVTNTPSWTDPIPRDGASHQYTVSTVSTSYNESVQSAAVTAG
jgi:hypothetical protein